MPINLIPPLGSITDTPIENIPQFIITLLFIVGIVIAIAFLIYGGIRWVLSGGDKTKVEAARGHIVAAIVGLVIIAGSFLIFSLVFQVLGARNPLTGSLCIPTLKNPFCFQQTSPTPTQTTPTATPSGTISGTISPSNKLTPAAKTKATSTPKPKPGQKATKGGQTSR